jgi:hypothetical protein
MNRLRGLHCRPTTWTGVNYRLRALAHDRLSPSVLTGREKKGAFPAGWLERLLRLGRVTLSFVARATEACSGPVLLQRIYSSSAPEFQTEIAEKARGRRNLLSAIVLLRQENYRNSAALMMLWAMSLMAQLFCWL